MQLNKSLTNIFASISIQRSSLMGLAMIAVFLTHAPSQKLGFLPTGFVGLISEYGFWGVDVFIFLSAFGLCYSLKKNNLKTFLTNRIVRILPIWYIVLLSIHIIGLVLGNIFPYMEFSYPQTLSDMFWWYSGLGFYFNTCSYEWYIPTILLFYSLSPLLYKCSIEKLIILLVGALFFYVINRIFDIVPHLNILFERLPVFILGFLFYKQYIRCSIVGFLNIELMYILLIIVLIFLNLCSATILFGALCPVVLMVIGNLLEQKWLKKFSTMFAFIGGVSLEFYLIHLYRRPQFFVSLFVENSNLQVILAFIICLVFAYILHYSINALLNRIVS